MTTSRPTLAAGQTYVTVEPQLSTQFVTILSLGAKGWITYERGLLEGGERHLVRTERRKRWTFEALLIGKAPVAAEAA